MKVVSEAANRNKQPILEVLQTVFSKHFASKVRVFECASGSGQHCVHLAEGLQDQLSSWQPSEQNLDVYLNSIRAYIAETSERVQSLIRPPVVFDVAVSAESYPAPGTVDVFLAINLIHISPLICTESLFRGAAYSLGTGGLLTFYGPFARDGVLEPQSNIDFDQSLRSRNPQWGIRDTSFLCKLAQESKFSGPEQIAMPSNNWILVFTKL